MAKQLMPTREEAEADMWTTFLRRGVVYQVGEWGKYSGMWGWAAIGSHDHLKLMEIAQQNPKALIQIHEVAR